MRPLQLDITQKKWLKVQINKLTKKYDALLPEQDVWADLIQDTGKIHETSKYNAEVKECLIKIMEYYQGLERYREVMEALNE